MSNTLSIAGLGNIKPLKWLDLGGGKIVSSGAGYIYIIRGEGGYKTLSIKSQSHVSAPIITLEESLICELKELADHHHELCVKGFLND